MKHLNQLDRQTGFTLTELIIVIVILGIISAVIAPLIGNKFGAVAQSTERAYWVQQGEYAFQHLAQDLARSIPNSVFTSEPLSTRDQVVEFLAANPERDLLAARYRDQQLSGYERLQPNNDVLFDVFGDFSSAPGWVSVGLPSSTVARSDWMGAQTDTGDTRFARVDSITAASGENGSPITRVQLNTSAYSPPNSGHRFGGHSPYFRAYFFDGPIGYACDTSTGFLYRISGYTSLATSQSFAARSAAGTRDRVISNVLSCEFTYQPGTTYAPPSLKVDLEIGAGNESIRLIDTLTLRNAS